jgi:hypothetical protein
VTRGRFIVPVDRSAWRDDGPWDREPDHEVGATPDGWVYRLARHSTLGVWCGYVLIPGDYPPELVGKVQSSEVVMGLRCGGKWWGFDSAHYGQVRPASGWGHDIAHYVTIREARVRCIEIAEEALKLWNQHENKE